MRLRHQYAESNKSSSRSPDAFADRQGRDDQLMRAERDQHRRSGAGSPASLRHSVSAAPTRALVAPPGQFKPVARLADHAGPGIGIAGPAGFSGRFVQHIGAVCRRCQGRGHRPSRPAMPDSPIATACGIGAWLMPTSARKRSRFPRQSGMQRSKPDGAAHGMGQPSAGFGQFQRGGSLTMATTSS